MSKKNATYLSYILLILLAVVYYNSANNFATESTSADLSPAFFPKLLSILLVLFCFIGLIQNFRTKAKSSKIEIPNLKMILITIAIIALFYLSWFTLGFFYINAFLFLIALSTLYSKKENIKKVMFTNSIVLLGTTLFIYLLIENLLNIRL